MAQLLPNVRQQFLDGNGLPLVAGKLHSYQAGTTTPLATYTDQSEGTPNANPTILDANGMASVWISQAAYKFVLKDSANNILWTVDNVLWIPAGSITTTKLVDANVTTAKLANLSVTTAKLDDASVTEGKLHDDSVATDKIQDEAVTNEKTANFGFVPPGAILPYGGTAAPSGFLLCDGASYLRATYPALAAALDSSGSTSNYGAADATHFNVPDSRGRFIRFWDDGAGNDPDSASRTAMATGGTTGDNVGSIQGDQTRSHSHALALRDAAGNGTNPQGTNGVTTAGAGTTNASGGNETRPINFSCNCIIKT